MGTPRSPNLRNGHRQPFGPVTSSQANIQDIFLAAKESAGGNSSLAFAMLSHVPKVPRLFIAGASSVFGHQSPAGAAARRVARHGSFAAFGLAARVVKSMSPKKRSRARSEGVVAGSASNLLQIAEELRRAAKVKVSSTDDVMAYVGGVITGLVSSAVAIKKPRAPLATLRPSQLSLNINGKGGIYENHEARRFSKDEPKTPRMILDSAKVCRV